MPTPTPTPSRSRTPTPTPAPTPTPTPNQAWTMEEDDHLMQLVRDHGPQSWSVIADKLPGRVGKQCRERYDGLGF